MRNHPSARRLALVSGLLASVASLPAPARAQQAANAATSETPAPDIVVTANRREENILDVPYNISVVTGADIVGSVTLDNAELLRSIPGATLIDQGPRNGAQFNSIRIRGLNVDGSAFGDYAVASVATVSTYVNETPVYANLALIDIDRVEVLRGPQGTLYGSGALGGTLKFMLAEPKIGETEGRVGSTLSSVNGSGSIGWTASAILNLPLGDTAAFRFNLLRQDYPGVTDYVNLYELDDAGVPVQPNGLFDRGFDSTRYTARKDADTFESWYARASLKWEPADTVKLVASYIFQTDDVGGRRQKTQGTNGIGEPYTGVSSGSVVEEPSERDFHLGALEVEVDFGFATLTSATSYYENSGSSESDNTGFYANNFAFYYYNYPRPLYTADRTFGDKAFSQELRLVSSGTNSIDYVLGAFFQKQTRRASQVSDLIGFEAYADALFPPADFVSTDNVFTYERNDDFRDFALFGELTWNVTDALRLTGGLRWFSNKSDVNTFVRVGAYDGFAGEVSTPFESKDDGLLYKLNAAYKFAGDDLLYATISRGYRRGGNNGVPTIGRFANDPGWVVYDPDWVTNYELGVKGLVSGIRYDASLYYIDWQNPQFNTSAPNGSFFAVVNGESARTMGLELQMSGRIGEKFGYALGYAYVDAELTADLLEPVNILNGERNVVAEKGSPLPGIPKHSFNLAVDFTQPIATGTNLILRVDGFYQSSTQNVLDEGIQQSREFGGFSIWDLTATVAQDRWSVALFVKNLFNVDGTTGAFTPEAFGPVPVAEYFGSNSRQFIALPRTIGLSATFAF